MFTWSCVFSWKKHAAHAIIFERKPWESLLGLKFLCKSIGCLKGVLFKCFWTHVPRLLSAIGWGGGSEKQVGNDQFTFFLFHASKDSRKKDGKRRQQSRRDHHLTVWCWCDFPQGSGSFSLSVSMPENLGHVQRFARIIIVYYAKIKRMCRPQNLVYVVLFYMEKVRGVVHSIVVYSNMAGVAWSTQNYY